MRYVISSIDLSLPNVRILSFSRQLVRKNPCEKKMAELIFDYTAELSRETSVRFNEGEFATWRRAYTFGITFAIARCSSYDRKRDNYSLLLYSLTCNYERAHTHINA